MWLNFLFLEQLCKLLVIFGKGVQGPHFIMENNLILMKLEMRWSDNPHFSPGEMLMKRGIYSYSRGAENLP